MMLPYFSEHFGNPSSQHAVGQRALQAVEEGRQQIAELIRADSHEIFLTSGSTESDNLAILGLARANKGNRRKIISFSTEHKAILSVGKQLEQEGFEFVIIGVNSLGHIDPEMLAAHIDEGTLLVSAQLANNEVGTIQRLRIIADLVHSQGALLHSDATQAVGKIPVDISELDVDLMSISAHKFYGPKGVGALFIRGGQRAIRIAPIGHGGGQEGSLRSGTHNVPGIVGFGEAARIAQQELAGEMVRLSVLRDSLEQYLKANILGLRIHGDLDFRLPGSTSLYFPDADAEALLANVPQLMLSTGAACESGAPEPSHVLMALGLSREEAYGTLRISLGRFNTQGEVTEASRLLFEAYSRVSSLQKKSTL